MKDYKGEVMKVRFYQEELSETKFYYIYLVDKVIRTKGDKLLGVWASIIHMTAGMTRVS